MMSVSGDGAMVAMVVRIVVVEKRWRLNKREKIEFTVVYDKTC
jgi:hypothetical protein